MASMNITSRAMNAGSGPRSYVQNSSYQRGALDAAISIIEEEIQTKFKIKHLGKLSEAKIDSFNFPSYVTTPQQLKAILERTTQSFSIERMEILDNPGKYSFPSVDARAAFIRAGFERLLTNHFGGEIIDELFNIYKNKLAASPAFLDPCNDKSV